MYTDFVLGPVKTDVYNTSGEFQGPAGVGLENVPRLQHGGGPVRLDFGMKRPFILNGHKCVTIDTGRLRFDEKFGAHVPILQTVRTKDLVDNGIHDPTWNANITLTQEQWKHFDRQMAKVSRPLLTAYNDIEEKATAGGFNAYEKMTHEYAAISDPGAARMGMDPIASAPTDIPQIKLRSTPLVVTYGEFEFSDRLLAVSRSNGGPGLDVSMGDSIIARCAELVEDITIGLVTGPTYGTISAGPGAQDGTSTLYGYSNLPARITKTTNHTPVGTNADVIWRDVGDMIELMRAQNFNGPYRLYHSTAYNIWLNSDYYLNGTGLTGKTLRDRLMDMKEIEATKLLPRWTASYGYQLLLVQWDGQFVQAINGMEFTPFMWDEKGGAQKRCRIMGMKQPLFKYDFRGIAPLVHGTVA